jgi:hypothetical protein
LTPPAAGEAAGLDVAGAELVDAVEVAGAAEDEAGFAEVAGVVDGDEVAQAESNSALITIMDTRITMNLFIIPSFINKTY